LNKQRTIHSVVDYKLVNESKHILSHDKELPCRRNRFKYVLLIFTPCKNNDEWIHRHFVYICYTTTTHNKAIVDHTLPALCTPITPPAATEWSVLFVHDVICS